MARVHSPARLLSAVRRERRALSQLVAETGGKHVPFGERGSGHYSAATKGCFDVIARCQGPALAALDRVFGARRRAGVVGSPFNLADFGTADGGTSLPLFRVLVHAIRAEEPSSPIVVAYEDQAQNDWQSVFHMTQGTLPNGPPGYLDGSVDNVYVVASGTSFYNQCFAPGSIDFAFSATAMHWLTQLPAEIPDALHSACTEDPAARDAFAAQAAMDWRQIMLMRARELRPGGQMVIANFAKDTHGRFLGQSFPRVKESMHHTFSELWREVAGPEVHRATNFPNEYRSLEACAAPFESAAGPVRAAGLRLIAAETALVECPFHTEWVQSGGDAAAYAARFVPTTRTWSNSTFVSGAVKAGVPDHEAVAMTNEMFAQYTARVAAAPADHAMDYVHSYVQVAKQD